MSLKKGRAHGQNYCLCCCFDLCLLCILKFNFWNDFFFFYPLRSGSERTITVLAETVKSYPSCPCPRKKKKSYARYKTTASHCSYGEKKRSSRIFVGECKFSLALCLFIRLFFFYPPVSITREREALKAVYGIPLMVR